VVIGRYSDCPDLFKQAYSVLNRLQRSVLTAEILGELWWCGHYVWWCDTMCDDVTLCVMMWHYVSVLTSEILGEFHYVYVCMYVRQVQLYMYWSPDTHGFLGPQRSHWSHITTRFPNPYVLVSFFLLSLAKRLMKRLSTIVGKMKPKRSVWENLR
jgi:hypothetical protein